MDICHCTLVDCAAPVVFEDVADLEILEEVAADHLVNSHVETLLGRSAIYR